MRNFCKHSFWLGLFLVLLVNCQTKHKPRYPLSPGVEKRFNELQIALIPFHTELGASQKGDWLYSHPEKGETFKEYVNKKPNQATEKRSKLYLALLSDFDAYQLDILQKTATYLSLFYGCETEIIQFSIDYKHIPEKYFRKNETQQIQILTDFFLKKVLLDSLPKDAFGMIGCTTTDIYPDPNWDFVFGQTEMSKNVAIWSMSRLKPEYLNENVTHLELIRNLKIASHEVGHILSLAHCTFNHCLMNGSAQIEETDRKPVFLCPICLGKLNYNRKFNLKERFERLKDFWITYQYSNNIDYYTKVTDIGFPQKAN